MTIRNKQGWVFPIDRRSREGFSAVGLVAGVLLVYRENG